MHTLLGPPRHLWKTGMIALGLTIALLAVGAALAPAIVDLAIPPATTVDTSTGRAPPPPTWATDPLAPPSLLRTR